MKRPSFQFYPGDWLHDIGVRACSLAARGLWMDMLSFMHQANPYGHLLLPTVGEDGGKDGGKDILKAILPPILARMVGSTSEEVERLLAELEQAEVFSRTAEGVIFSRRMVREFQAEEICTNWGLVSSVLDTCASILARKHCGSVHYVESRVKPLKPKNVETKPGECAHDAVNESNAISGQQSCIVSCLPTTHDLAWFVITRAFVGTSRY